jgi:uncharacterized membrane protein YfcA
LSPQDILLGLLIFVLTGIANAAGIAGASVLIPIAILVGGFNTHMAIPMVNTAVFGGVCVAAVLRIKLRHLVVNKPRIDYDAAMHLCMPMLLGAIAGVILNTVMPEWAILVLLLIVLGYSTFSVFTRAISIHKLGPMEEPILHRQSRETTGDLGAIYQEEAKTAPCNQLMWIGGMLIIVIISVFIRGGKGIESVLGFASCSLGYWTATALFILICVLFMCFTTNILIAKNAHYEAVGYPFSKGDFHWTRSECLTVIAGGIVTGLVSGLFGIAGGVVLIPILLALNMRPEVANATCSFLTFFTNFTTFLQFTAAGVVTYDYAVTYFVLSMVGSLLGVTLLERVVRKMQSATVFLLGIIMAIATILIPVYEIRHVIMQVEIGTFHPGFNEFC